MELSKGEERAGSLAKDLTNFIPFSLHMCRRGNHVGISSFKKKKIISERKKKRISITLYSK